MSDIRDSQSFLDGDAERREELLYDEIDRLKVEIEALKSGVINKPCICGSKPDDMPCLCGLEAYKKSKED